MFDRSYASNPGTAAVTDMNLWKYRTATITFYLPKISEHDDDEVEKVVIHELCHVLLSPISTNMLDQNGDYQTQLMEFNTELVTSAMLWVYQAGKDEEAHAKRKQSVDKPKPTVSDRGHEITQADPVLYIGNTPAEVLAPEIRETARKGDKKPREV